MKSLKCSYAQFHVNGLCVIIAVSHIKTLIKSVELTLSLTVIQLIFISNRLKKFYHFQELLVIIILVTTVLKLAPGPGL